MITNPLRPLNRALDRLIDRLEPAIDLLPVHAFVAMSVGYAVAGLVVLAFSMALLTSTGVVTPRRDAPRLLTLEQCHAWQQEGR